LKLKINGKVKRSEKRDLAEWSEKQHLVENSERIGKEEVTERSGEKISSEMREKKGNMIRFGLVI
jgi:hypothetical protein